MLCKLFLLISATVFGTAIATIETEVGAIREGAYKYFYDSSVPNACESVIFLGVGTAMSVNDYNNIGTEISTGKPIVTVIVDHNPRIFVKTSDRKFASYYNALVPDLQSRIPACANTPNPKILVAAHSASGQAAVKALPKLETKPSGFIGLDPFRITEGKMKIDPSLPSLEWGFAKTTCSVKIDQAAKPAYSISSPDHRVFYRVDNAAQGISHCVFTDKGCAIVCGLKKDGGWVIPAVAASIHTFVDAIVNGEGNIEKSSFESDVVKDGKVELFVNGDDPDAKSEL